MVAALYVQTGGAYYGLPDVDPCVRRFWSRTVASGECLLWTGARTHNGYGSLVFRGRGARAHRVAWEIANGNPAGAMMVLHACDNRLCVRPEHLSLGSAAQNSADMVAKGRQAAGERNRHAKLTAGEVRCIRDAVARGEDHDSVASRYMVSRPTVSDIAARKTWRHV